MRIILRSFGAVSMCWAEMIDQEKLRLPGFKRWEAVATRVRHFMNPLVDIPMVTGVHVSREKPPQSYLLAKISLLVLFLLPFALRPGLFSGDEPHYVLVASSIKIDGDLELSNDYDRVAAGENRAGKRFAGRALDRHTVIIDHSIRPPKIVATGNGGEPLPEMTAAHRERSVRAIGWPAAIAAFSFALPSVPLDLVAKILAHLCVIGCAVFVALAALRTGATDFGAFGAGLAVAMGSSFWIYANTAFAEPLLGLCLACSLYCLTGRDHPLLLGGAIAMGMWTKFQFYPVALTFLVIAFLVYPPTKRWLLVLIIGLCAGSLAIFHLLEYGTLKPPMTWVPGEPIAALRHFFVNPSTSIIRESSWLIIVVIAASVSFFQGLPKPSITWWMISFSICAPPVLWGIYDGGHCFPGRLIMLLFLPAALFFAHLLDSPSRSIRTLSIALLVAAILSNLAAALRDPSITWVSS